MAKSITPNKPAATPDAVKAQGTGEVIQNAEAVLTSAQTVHTVSLAAKGKREKWTTKFEVNAEELPPEVVAYLIQFALDKIVATAATGKVKVTKGDEKIEVEKTEAMVAALVQARLDGFAAGRTGERGGKVTMSKVEKEMVKIASERIRARVKQLEKSIKPDRVKKLANDYIKGPHAPVLRALAEKRLKEAEDVTSSIDLKGLGIEKAMEDKPAPKKRAKKEEISEDDLADA